MHYNKLLFSTLFCFAFSFGFSQNKYVSTYAGLDSAGYKNGADSVALFNAPTGLATDTAGNVYVADTYNNVIRKISTSGQVTTYGGNDTAGYRNGADSVAEFKMPFGICTDRAGNVYVADTYNNVIRKISTSGQVTTFAGNDTAGYRNGADSVAEFNLPTGVAADTLGNIYVADNANQVVREISASGTVSTFAGNNIAGYVNKVADSAEFWGLYGIAVDDSGNVFVTEYLNNDIREIRKDTVRTVSGNIYINTPYGYKNGQVDSALFNNPAGIVVDDTGYIYIADEYNNVIRKIKHDTVYTIAGNDTAGYINGMVNRAEFNEVLGLAMDKKGNFYIADDGNNLVRKIGPMAPLGIAQLSSRNPYILVYPNPCNDKLIIATAPAGRAELFDMMGREVWNEERFKAPYILSTANLIPGMYFLRISDGTASSTQKILIQR